MDYAHYKRVLEYCNHYHPLTDDTAEYDHKQGYLGIHTPSYVTVDLEAVVRLRQIAFKLWDYSDPCNVSPIKSEMTDQVYTYRLLASVDKKTWTVIYDCSILSENMKYHRGWQVFNWKSGTCLEARYVRVHCIHNRRTSGFHIVKLHACDIPEEYENAETKVDFDKEQLFTKEVGDAYPLSYQLMDLSGRLEDMLSSSMDGNENAQAIYSDIVDTLCQKSREVEAVNGKVDEIRRLVASPVGNMIRNKFHTENSGKEKNFYFSLIQLIVWYGQKNEMYNIGYE